MDLNGTLSAYTNMLTWSIMVRLTLCLLHVLIIMQGLIDDKEYDLQIMLINESIESLINYLKYIFMLN